jgi:hypothetical protein
MPPTNRSTPNSAVRPKFTQPPTAGRIRASAAHSHRRLCDRWLVRQLVVAGSGFRCILGIRIAVEVASRRLTSVGLARPGRSSPNG